MGGEIIFGVWAIAMVLVGLACAFSLSVRVFQGPDEGASAKTFWLKQAAKFAVCLFAVWQVTIFVRSSL